MSLTQRHARRVNRLQWIRWWSPSGASVEEDSGFLAERAQSEYWSQNLHLSSLDELDSTPCLFALGDPALGKSWDIEAYATRIRKRISATQRAPGDDTELLLDFDATELTSAELLREKIFGAPLDAWKLGDGRAYIIIDSLDEAPFGIEAFANALLNELEEVPIERLRLRIACRTALRPTVLRDGLQRLFGSKEESKQVLDGSGQRAARLIPASAELLQGEESLDSLAVSASGADSNASNSAMQSYREVEIAILTRADAHLAASSRLGSEAAANQFLEAVGDADADAFAARPQTLFALIKRYSSGEPLNASQEVLFRSMCQSLSDPSPGRLGPLRSSYPVTSRDDRYRIAARISAGMLFSNRPKIWISASPVESAGALDITAVTGSERMGNVTIRVTESELWEAVNTALFTGSTDKMALAAHLTFAEFLAADWVAVNELPLTQIKSLLTDPTDVDRRVLPQLRQVAAWLSAMRNDVFDALAVAEPDIMLWSDVVQLPPSKRPDIVDALLRGTTNNTILNPPFGKRARLNRLAHSQLGNQLASAIKDPSLPERTRELALDIAWANQVSSTAAEAVHLALSDSEPIDLRALAARLVADAGADDDKKALIGLVQNPSEVDVADELKGAALIASWRQMTPTALFAVITPLKRPNWGGAYSSALREIAESLTTDYAVEAAKWLVSHSHQTLSSLDGISRSALKLAIANHNQPEILEALAKYALKRIRRYEPIVDRERPHRSPDDDLGRRIQENIDLRHNWVLEILRLHDGPVRVLSQVAHDYPQLFTSTDIPWGISQAANLPSDDIRRNGWAELLRWSFDYERPSIEAVFGHRNDPTISHLFPDLLAFTTADEAAALVASQRAKRVEEIADMERRHASEDERRLAADPPVEPGSLKERVSKLEASKKSVAQRWPGIAWEILRISARRVSYSISAQQLEELQSLRGSGAEAAVSNAADEYLRTAQVPKDPFPKGATRWEVIFGFLAAIALKDLNPDKFNDLNEAIWARWMRSLIGHFTDSHEEPLQVEVLRRAAIRAPSSARLEFMRLIDSDARRRRGWIRDSMLDVALSVAGSEKILAKRIKQGKYDADATENLLDQLLSKGSEAVRSSALVLFRQLNTNVVETNSPNEMDSRAIAAGIALLFKSPTTIWDDLWSLMSSSDVMARNFLVLAARRREFIEKSALDTISPKQLADFYLLLHRLYPPATDPWHITVFTPGPRDNLQNLREGLLRALQIRKTPEAVSELERIARTPPVRDYLVQAWLQARSGLRGDRWLGIDPTQLMRLAELSTLRVVESSSQLLDIVLESLARLQKDLQGELRSVVGLWNESKNGNDPKSEAHFANEVTRHLRRDLRERQIVIGRELSIQVGILGGARGLRTDIDVQAPRLGPPHDNDPVPRVVIEVKGSWHADVSNAMRTQLVEQYLEPQRILSGLYLVAYYTCNSWKKNSAYRQSARHGSVAQLQAKLNDQASGLSNPMREVRALVVDATLPERINDTVAIAKSTVQSRSRPKQTHRKARAEGQKPMPLNPKSNPRLPSAIRVRRGENRPSRRRK